LKKLVTPVLLALLIGSATWLSMTEEQYEWRIAPNLPLPGVPLDNPMSDVKVELGRHLFYDTRLSINNTTSCASCHVQALAFTDGRPKSVGATGELHPRGAMSLVNTAYASRLTWANSLLDQLEKPRYREIERGGTRVGRCRLLYFFE